MKLERLKAKLTDLDGPTHWANVRSIGRMGFHDARTDCGERPVVMWVVDDTEPVTCPECLAERGRPYVDAALEILATTGRPAVAT